VSAARHAIQLHSVLLSPENFGGAPSRLRCPLSDARAGARGSRAKIRVRGQARLRRLLHAVQRGPQSKLHFSIRFELDQ